MTRRAGALVGAAAVAVTVSLVIGLWAAPRLLRPSDAEIDRALSELVPTDATVVDRSAGPQGTFPSEGPYHSFVEFEQDGHPEHRMSAVLAAAERHGWTVGEQGTTQAATILEVEQGAIDGRVSVLNGGTTRVNVEAGTVPWSTRASIAAVAGAIGLGLVAAVTWMLRRTTSSATRRPERRPDRSSP